MGVLQAAVAALPRDRHKRTSTASWSIDWVYSRGSGRVEGSDQSNSNGCIGYDWYGWRNWL